MKRLNNKGYMLVEIILAFVLAMTIMYFITELTINVKNKNDDLMVETIVKADQTIITNKFMDYILKEGENFSCDKVFVNTENKIVKYGDDIITIVDDSATLSGASCNALRGKVSINIPINVEQMPDKKFDVNINYRYDSSCAKVAVDLDDGMIPVVIDPDGTVTTIDENDNGWYNYCEHSWANIVLVKESATEGVDGSKSREFYKNNPGVEVLESDILAYYVWIPRYSYMIWTTNFNNLSNGSGKMENKISIKFETKNDEKQTGVSVGEFRTHPAFTFGTQELNGIWVGKFETSIDSSVGSCYTNNNCNKIFGNDLRVKPNVNSLMSLNIGNSFYSSLNFSGTEYNSSANTMTIKGNGFYGLTTKSNSHMMKNSEWGAIAYLAYSEYGLFDDTGHEALKVLQNIQGNWYTGVSYLTGFGFKTESQENEYNSYFWSQDPTGELFDNVKDYLVQYGKGLDNIYNSSVNGNISGIFDMAGNAREYLAAYTESGSENYGSNLSKATAVNLKNIGYFDSYNNINGNVNISETGGHALFETYCWYGTECEAILDNNALWIERGSQSGCGGNLFQITDSAGAAFGNYTFRSVLFVNSN